MRRILQFPEPIAECLCGLEVEAQPFPVDELQIRLRARASLADPSACKAVADTAVANRRGRLSWRPKRVWEKQYGRSYEGTPGLHQNNVVDPDNDFVLVKRPL